MIWKIEITIEALCSRALFGFSFSSEATSVEWPRTQYKDGFVLSVCEQLRGLGPIRASTDRLFHLRMGGIPTRCLSACLLGNGNATKCRECSILSKLVL